LEVVAALLIILGTSFELVALDMARRDLRDARKHGQEREARLSSTMGASKYVVSEWIDRATRTRRMGVWLFAGGLTVQSIANLIGLRLA
jgi:hypothetical protein